MYALPVNKRRRLHGRAYRAQQSGHHEVCGLIIADRGRALDLVFIPNDASRPGSWELSTQKVANVRRALRGSTRRVVGTFHSHPVGYAKPGRSDMQRAPLNSLMLVYDVCGRDAQLWLCCRATAEASPVNPCYEG